MKKNEKENDDINLTKLFGLLGVTIVGGLAVGFIAPKAIDEIRDSTSPYAQLSEGLNLSRKGIHLRQGDHNVIITNSFYENLDKTYDIRRDLTVESIKEAYNVLNQYNRGIQFNLCTTDTELSKRYDIPMVKDTAIDDIYIYGTNEVIGNNKKTVGQAHWDYDRNTYELKDLKIILKLNSLYSVWKSYGSLEKTFTPRNWAVFGVVIHETMHDMGFDHITNRESILNPVTTIPDLNEEDIKLIDKYNMQFYGMESIFENSEENKNVSNYEYSNYEISM